MTFEVGKSGNEKGRPSGIGDKRTKLRELLEPHAADLINKCVELALDGDPQALRLCIERLIPRIKEEPINITLPQEKITFNSLPGISEHIFRQLENASAAPDQVKTLFDIIKIYRENMDLNELFEKLQTLRHEIEELKQQPIRKSL